MSSHFKSQVSQKLRQQQVLMIELRIKKNKTKQIMLNSFSSSFLPFCVAQDIVSAHSTQEVAFNLFF
jgi:hypothetical protein